MRHSRSHLTIVLLLIVGLGTGSLASILPPQAAGDFPATVRDDEFWKMISDFSEDEGAFASELMSNEIGYPFVIPELKRITKPGGAYLGVGPEQNFTYIAAVEPGIAFIIDVRRQNMLEHLIYKAVFEMSADRVEFVSRLFSRRQPSGIGAASTAQALFQAFSKGSPDPQLFDENLKAIEVNLVQQHHFGLTDIDLMEIETLYKSFRDIGPGFFETSRREKAIYGDLMADTDNLGQERSYLSSEDNYRIVRALERKNLVIPLVGDFAGSKALRAVGQYLRERHTTVSAFYISNVEDYLFSSMVRSDTGVWIANTGAWRRFYSNVGMIPIDRTSIFIRSEGSGNPDIPSGPDTPRVSRAQPGGTHFTMLISSMSEVIQAFDEGRIENQTQVLKMSRKP